MRKSVPILLSFALFGGMCMAQSASMPANESQPPSMSPAAAPNAETAPAPARHRTPNPERQAKFLSKKLSLTADQQGRIEPILESRMQQIQTLRADSTLSPQDRHAKVSAIRQDAYMQIEAVLSDAQKQQFEQMKKAAHEHRQERRSQATTAAPGE